MSCCTSCLLQRATLQARRAVFVLSAAPVQKHSACAVSIVILLTCHRKCNLILAALPTPPSAEDVALIESLEESKRVATEIGEKVVEARETEVAINDSRNRYRPVAERGAMLFFLLNSLSKIHAFYQYSLTAFVSVYCRGLDAAPGGRHKRKKDVTLGQLQARVSGSAADYDEVIKRAKRQSSTTDGGLAVPYNPLTPPTKSEV